MSPEFILFPARLNAGLSDSHQQMGKVGNKHNVNINLRRNYVLGNRAENSTVDTVGLNSVSITPVFALK